jgi:hypothetical protein
MARKLPSDPAIQIDGSFLSGSYQIKSHRQKHGQEFLLADWSSAFRTSPHEKSMAWEEVQPN